MASNQWEADQERRARFSRLPAPLRLEDVVAGADGGPEPFERGEHDAEVFWLLRTVGIG